MELSEWIFRFIEWPRLCPAPWLRRWMDVIRSLCTNPQLGQRLCPRAVGPIWCASWLSRSCLYLYRHAWIAILVAPHPNPFSHPAVTARACAAPSCSATSPSGSSSPSPSPRSPAATIATIKRAATTCCRFWCVAALGALFLRLGLCLRQVPASPESHTRRSTMCVNMHAQLHHYCQAHRNIMVCDSWAPSPGALLLADVNHAHHIKVAPLHPGPLD